MGKILFLALAFILSLNINPANAQWDNCKQHLPFGTPVYTGHDASTPLCRVGYATLHDNNAKVPIWTSFSLTAEKAVGCVPRKDAFKADLDVPKDGRSNLSDYLNSNYDKGHLASDMSMAWSEVSAQQSFLLSNMAPQVHGFNAGIWEATERMERFSAIALGEVVVFTGPILTDRSKTIGAHVVVPPSFFKIVFDKNKPNALAWIIPHVENYSSDLTPYMVSVTDIEKVTNITVPVPKGFDKTAKTKPWAVNTTGWAQIKQKACSVSH